jgi:hypothetical protein
VASVKPITWIRLIAYAERPSSGRAPRRVETDADVALRTAHRVVVQLRAAIEAEMASEGRAPNRPAMRIDDRPPFGFQVTSTDAAASSRTLAIALTGRSVTCRYCVNTDAALGSKSRWLEFAADQRALVVWDQGVRRRFNGIESLAVFLLAVR